MFFLLGGITLLGAIFIQVFVKETKGLSDLEKKQLYMPEDCKVNANTDKVSVTKVADN